MSLKTPSTGSDRKLPEAGIHTARLVAIIDQGTQQGVWGGKPKVLLGWELPDEPTYEWEDETRACMVWESYTASLADKANLRKMLEGWRGRPFTTEELEAFSFKSLLAQPCMIGVIHSDCGKYANLSSVNALRKPAVCPEQITASVFFDLDDPDWSLFETFSEKMQAKIKATPEYQEARMGPHEGDPRQQDQQREEPPEDDIPF